MEEYQNSEDRVKYDAEELECVNAFLDKLNVPTHHEKGNKYSTVGRIIALLRMQQTPFYEGNID